MRAVHRVVVAAAVAALLAGCGRLDAHAPVARGVGPAPPQTLELGWVERYGDPGASLVFRVHELVVEEDGWRARVAVENDTDVAYAIGEGALLRDFGLLLFVTGGLEELQQRNQAADLPPVRRARRYDPPLPERLGPRERWSGTISAPGRLPAGRWARFGFGWFVAEASPPEGLGRRVYWITDRATRLRP
jgi:hypothetical protein